VGGNLQLDDPVVYSQPEPMATDGPPAASRPFSMVEMVSTLLRAWRLVVILPLLLALGVGALTLTSDRMYEASASFLPQVSEGRAPSGAAALAQQLGMNIGGDAGTQSPQFYADVLQSLVVLRQVVESTYEVRTRQGEVRQGTLVDFYEVDAETGLLPPWRLAVEELRRNLSSSVTGTGVVQLRVVAAEPELAEQVAERILELLNDFNMEMRQVRAQEETRFIASRVEAARGELRTAEDAVQTFLNRNHQYRNAPALLFEFERLQRQMVIRQDVYTSLLRAHEQSRLDAIRDTPVLTLLDHPAGTAEPQSRGTVVRTLLAFMLGLTLAVLIAFGRELLLRSRENDPRSWELERVAHDAPSDSRSATRWVNVARESDAAGEQRG
jgi:uncharacterized protein involved in exopolysaccharide biosynthesis